MSKSFNPIVRQVVGKLSVGCTEDEAAEFFWSKVKNRGKDLPEDKWEELDSQARQCHRENVKMCNRVMSGQLGEE